LADRIASPARPDVAVRQPAARKYRLLNDAGAIAAATLFAMVTMCCSAKLPRPAGRPAS
jgi:hypothetical protein